MSRQEKQTRSGLNSVAASRTALAPLGFGKEGQIEDALPHVRLAAMNKISEIGHTDGIDLLAGEKDIKNRIHDCSELKFWSSEQLITQDQNLTFILSPRVSPRSRRSGCDT